MKGSKVARARFHFPERMQKLQSKTKKQMAVPDGKGGNTMLSFRATGRGESSQWLPLYSRETAEFLEENVDNAEVEYV